MIELAAFLGNPGSTYTRTRHNAGFLLAQALPFYESLSWQKKFKGQYAVMDGAKLSSSPEVAGRIHFLKPETYMNRSGESVAAAASFFKLQPSSIIVIHDELELPLGTVSLKFSGGLGGHNGLRSMKASFGTADFWRIRIGIGRPDARLPGEGGREGSGEGITDWVLSPFSEGEQELLNLVLAAGAELLVQTFQQEPETLLGAWAKKKLSLSDL